MKNPHFILAQNLEKSEGKNTTIILLYVHTYTYILHTSITIAIAQYIHV